MSIDMQSLPIMRISHIPVGNPNRPGGSITIRHITIHETANTRPGANAEMHRRYTHNGGGPELTSYNYVVDSLEVIELLPPGEPSFHAGTQTGNYSGISIELCVNIDGDWLQTLRRGAELVAMLMTQHGVPLDKVVQHNHWSGKNCPTTLRQGSNWEDFLSLVRAALTPRPPQHSVGDGLRRALRDLGDEPAGDELYVKTPQGEWSLCFGRKFVVAWHPNRGAYKLGEKLP